MSKIVIDSFTGERPRFTPTLLPTHAAQNADNCNIVRGSLKAFGKPKSIYQLVNTGTLGTVYLYRANAGTQYWLEWTQDVDVQPGPIAGDTTKRAYFTGTDMPRVFDDTMVNSGGGATFPKSNFRMGVPKPTAALTATLGAGGSGTARDVNYVFTYVRKWASGKVDEGQPSVASNTLSALQGQTVTLDTFPAAPDAEYGVTHRWIYRINTGTTGAEYQFVKEITIATTTTTEALADTALGEIIPSEEWAEPPTDLKGLISLPNGCFAGFFGNQVALSYPYQVHAWPTRYQLAFPFKVVAIGNIKSTVVVATESQAYIVHGLDPESMSVDKVNGIYPCVSKRGLCSVDGSVIYPTHDGIAYVTAGGGSGLLTKDLASKDEWKDFFPATAKAAGYRNRYFFFFNTAGSTSAISDNGALLNYLEADSGFVGLFGGVHCVHVDQIDGKLYYVALNETENRPYVYQWDSLVERTPYAWRSKKFIAPEKLHFCAGRILGGWEDALSQADADAYIADRDAIIAANQALLATDDTGSINGAALNVEEINGDGLQTVPPALTDIVGLTLALYADGVLATSQTVDSAEPFRLPAGLRGTVFEVELQGQIEVQQVTVAPSIEEIADA